MPHDRKISLNTLPLHFGKVLTGSHGGGSEPARDIPRYLRLMQGGGFDPRGMISHRGPLSEINDLIARLRSGEAIHALLRFPAFQS